MDLLVDQARLAALEPELLRRAPWMHPYRFGERTIVGHFKYQRIAETCCVSTSPSELVERMTQAYVDYMAGQPYHFMDAVIERLGADTGSSTALDIACATGRYSFYLALNRAGSVRAVEIRPEQVAQCRLVQRVDPRFASASLTFDHEARSADDPEFLVGESYDVVLSMGLLYHLANPLQHLANLRRLTRRFAVVYTLTHTMAPGGLWQLDREDTTWMTKAVEGISWVPYFADVPDVLRSCGFERVEVVTHPLAEQFQRRLLAAEASGSRIRRKLHREVRSLRHPNLDGPAKYGHNPAYFLFIAS